MSDVIRMHAVGGPSVLVAEQETVGAPGPGQVKIRHTAIGVNFIDTMFRSGAFGVSLPFVNGVEGAGDVIEVGAGVENLQVGDRVAYFFAPGAYAQERIIDTAPLVRLPQDVPTQLAAGMLTRGATAWLAVRMLHQVRQGDVILVQGATGGVGSLVARWARKLGATVIAVGSSAKLARLPADIVHRLASESADLGTDIRAIAPDGVDVVYDFVGRATADASLEAVRDGGAIFTIGAASGAANFDEQLVASRRITVRHASAASAVKGAALEAAAQEVFECWRDGTFGEIELDRYALKDAAIAHQAIADRTIGSNPVLLP
ncbi:zinc-binding dehydrogenase [Sphingobium sp. LMA1-1-1.1]|uniref:zinc-binding dehydrogenase n=1 Tax=unclassified Sphingobium TaxID=2611147 RepID=UPI003416FECF